MGAIQSDTNKRGSGDERAPEPQYIVVGRVLRPHGVRGEFRMEIITDYPERLEEHGHLYLAPPHSPNDVERYPLEKIRPHQGILLVKLGGCDDRNAAEELRGMLVEIPLEEAVPLEEDEYYLFQVIGSRVETEEGEWLGQLDEILETGANDVYVMHGPWGEVLLPAVDSVVLEIDPVERTIIVRPPPGTLEES